MRAVHAPSKVSLKIYSVEGRDVRHCKHGVSIRFDLRESWLLWVAQVACCVFDFMDDFQFNERREHDVTLSPVLSVNTGKILVIFNGLMILINRYGYHCRQFSL